MTRTSVAARVEIPRFPQGKRIAVTTSWDDGAVEDRRIIRAFNEWGLKGTFNLTSGFLANGGNIRPIESGGHIDASEVRYLYAGHEVALHSVTHPDFTLLDSSQIAAEVTNNRLVLEDLVGYPVRGFAYPGGTYDRRVSDILRSLGVVYARTVENANPCFPPVDALAWHPSLHQFGHTVRMPRDQPDAVNRHWEALYDHPHGAGGVFSIWGHSYEFARGRSWDDFERIYRPLAGKSDVWYCTNIELFDYEAARQRLVLSANRRVVYNPSAIRITVKLDGKCREVPPGAVTELLLS